MHTPSLAKLTIVIAIVVLAITAVSQTAYGGPSLSTHPVIAPLVAMHPIDMRTIPQEAFSPTGHHPGAMPLLVGTSPAAWYARKLAARSNPYAPRDPHPIPDDNLGNPLTPPLSETFAGLADSGTTCPYFGGSGCTPPDMALAVSTNYVVQFVNTSIAVYSPEGVLATGFPKNAADFFQIPAPGACDPAGAFTSDPRAFYDPKDGRFWVTILQVEGAFGVAPYCSEASVYWVAVSQTSDPTGAWNVYAFNMLSGTNAADYTQTGLDGRAFYFGGNMFDSSGSYFAYDDIFAADKAKMEAGQPVTAHGLSQIAIGQTLVDTLQPVLVEGRAPSAGLFVDSFNINSGYGNCFVPCNGINVFAMANPLTSPSLTYATLPSLPYTLPPVAYEPGGYGLETLDTRISATPVYRNGMITGALDTGVSRVAGVVPGVMWFQVKPTLSGSRVTGGSTPQNAILSFRGNRAALFGATMTDTSGDMLLVFDSTSKTLYPSIYYASRLSTDPPSTLQPIVLLKKGLSSIPSGFGPARWGDYEAAAYDGSNDLNIWFASEYTNANADWSTQIGMAHL